VAAQPDDRAGDRRGAGGDGHRHVQGVIDEQRRAGDEGWVGAQILPAHDVGAAARGIGEDRLAIAHHQDHEYRHHDEGDRHDVVQGGHARYRHEHTEDDLGAISRRRHGVGTEHRLGDELAQPLMYRLVGRERAAHHQLNKNLRRLPNPS
jgi:hypothetical protein